MIDHYTDHGTGVGYVPLENEAIKNIFKIKALDVFKCLKNSKLLKTLAIVGVVTVISATAALCPPIVCSVILLASIIFAPPIIKQISEKFVQKISFEVSVIGRNLNPLLGKDSFNEILIENGKTTNVILGCMPNKANAHFNNFVENQNVGLIVSINESFERFNMGFSVPFSADDYKELGSEYVEFTSDDHVPVDVSVLNQAADRINHYMEQNPNKKVYIHCRAGKGRSAMLVAAYLIKYKKLKVKDAVKAIKNSRPGSSIDKQEKIIRLKEFKKQWGYKL